MCASPRLTVKAALVVEQLARENGELAVFVPSVVDVRWLLYSDGNCAVSGKG